MNHRGIIVIAGGEIDGGAQPAKRFGGDLVRFRLGMIGDVAGVDNQVRSEIEIVDGSQQGLGSLQCIGAPEFEIRRRTEVSVADVDRLNHVVAVKTRGAGYRFRLWDNSHEYSSSIS